MKNILGIQAFLFDMDGTLVDSEQNTEIAIRELLDQQQISHSNLDCKQFYGITWRRVELLLRELYPKLSQIDLAPFLQKRFHHLFKTSLEVPGSISFLKEAHQKVKTGLCTSSNRECVNFLMERFSLQKSLDTVMCADNYERSKPDPQCFLLAAESLGVAPSACLVFEDSVAGLQAARAAGMFSIGITHRSPDLTQVTALATHITRDYQALGASFISSVCAPH
jgi:HAD superfamily hydrolase (TIGR01509 family)